MEIKIHDVEHGFCASILADDGSVTLIDCGHNSTTGWRPSKYLREQGHSSLAHLVISNYDEDHLSDLPDLIKAMPIKVLVRNLSVEPRTLFKLKRAEGPLGSGTLAILLMALHYTRPYFPIMDELRNLPIGLRAPDVWSALASGRYRLPRPRFDFFWNPWRIFRDTNNLSLVTFAEYGGISIVFPGDLEKAGWQVLLKDPRFRECLSRVNVFVASHHGRENGYCAEVFDHCKPDLVIISDGNIKYETQKKDLYSKHAGGTSVGLGFRHVLTTRKDGTITIRPGGVWLPYSVETEASQAKLAQLMASLEPRSPWEKPYGYSKHSADRMLASKTNNPYEGCYSAPEVRSAISLWGDSLRDVEAALRQLPPSPSPYPPLQGSYGDGKSTSDRIPRWEDIFR